MDDAAKSEPKSHLEYRFARSQDGSPLDITNLPEGRPKGITCFGCQGRMVARLGPKRVHHFAHYRKVDCNWETYLHILAKNVFCLQFKRAIRENKPFLIGMPHPHICARFEEFPTCRESFGFTPRVWSLTKHYNHAELEKKHGPYVADVLLTHSDHPERYLFVEMRVSHASTEEKIGSVKMIEIPIEDENRIDDFDNFFIRAGTFTPYKINLNPIKVNAPCICALRMEEDKDSESLRQLAQARWKQLQDQREEAEKRQAEILAAQEALEASLAEQRKTSQRVFRQERKMEQVMSAEVYQSSARFRQCFQNTGEWQSPSGPCVVVKSHFSPKQPPPSLAYIMAYMSSGDGSFNDYQRGIIIRRRIGPGRPFILEVEGHGQYDFQKLSEAVDKYFSIAR